MQLLHATMSSKLCMVEILNIAVFIIVRHAGMSNLEINTSVGIANVQITIAQSHVCKILRKFVFDEIIMGCLINVHMNIAQNLLSILETTDFAMTISNHKITAQSKAQASVKTNNSLKGFDCFFRVKLLL